jgi:lysozyme
MHYKFLLSSLLLFGFTFSKPTNNFPNVTKKFEIHGIDVSHHQNHINWDHVAENQKFKISFCFIKATEGSSFTDNKFNRNWRECKNVDIKRGAYHFFNSSCNAKSQALNYIRTVGLSTGDLAPVLDFEHESEIHSKAQIRKNLKTWLSIVKRHYGKTPIIYTNSSIYERYIKGYFKDFPLWIADYNTTNIKYNVNSENLKFWQYSESGRVKGIKGKVDINAFLGETQELDELTIQ